MVLLLGVLSTQQTSSKSLLKAANMTGMIILMLGFMTMMATCKTLFERDECGMTSTLGRDCNHASCKAVRLG